MFAVIDCKSANHIAINIPPEGAERSLPALAGMLERNAVFIHKGWNKAEIVEPEMKIILGECVRYDFGEQGEFVVGSPEQRDVLDESFALATPEIFVSNKKLIEAKDKEIARLKAELHLAYAGADASEAQVNELKARIQSFSELQLLHESTLAQEAA